jgi:hypothetical protein
MTAKELRNAAYGVDDPRPIMLEAANRIEELEAALAECERRLDQQYSAMIKANNLAVEYQNKLAECEREKQWQPIETAAPDQVGLFWLDWAPGCGGNYGMAQSNHIHYGKRGGWSSLFRATHWMPLPEPPAALTEANEGKQ